MKATITKSQSIARSIGLTLITAFMGASALLGISTFLMMFTMPIDIAIIQFPNQWMVWAFYLVGALAFASWYKTMTKGK